MRHVLLAGIVELTCMFDCIGEDQEAGGHLGAWLHVPRTYVAILQGEAERAKK